VTLKVGPQLAKGEEIFHRKIASLGQRGIVHRSGVAFGENELIAVLPSRLSGRCLMTLKNRAVIMSAYERDPPGCPDWAAKVIFDDMATEQVGLVLQHLDGLVIIHSQQWHLGMEGLS
jgi:hypothetical protein